jgi:hypothetical protein
LKHPSKEVAVSLSNTFLIDMTAAADALGDNTATYAATTTMAVPGLAIGFAAASAFAQDDAPWTSADTAGYVSAGHIMSGHSLELSIDFPYGAAPAAFDVSITTLSSHGGANILSGYSLPELGTSLHGLF